MSSKSFIVGDMTSMIKQEIVDTHNNLRATLNATNMQKMVRKYLRVCDRSLYIFNNYVIVLIYFI